MTERAWQISERRGGSLLGITFTSSAWPPASLRGRRGETLYLKVTSAQGWKRLVYDGKGDAHMEEGLSLAQALRRVPDSLRDDVIQAHRDVVDATLGEVGKWGSRLGRYREELRDVVGSAEGAPESR